MIAREEKFPEIYHTHDRILLFVSAFYKHPDHITEDGDETEEEYEIASPKQLSKMLPPKSRKRAKTGSTPGAGPSSAPLHLQEGPKPE